MGGLRGFPFGMVRSSPWQGVLGAWRLNEYVSVGKLQARYNQDRRTSRTAHEADASLPYIATGAIREDKQWGPNTMSAVRAWVDYKVRKGDCTETSGTEAERNGPNSFKACLENAGFGMGEIMELQVAWQDYKTEKARQDRLETTERAACAERGGTWDSSTDSCVEPGGLVDVRPVVEEEGMSTGAKVAIGIVVAILLVGGYYVITD